MKGGVMKQCTICGLVKPYSDFHRQSDRGDGYCSWCKPCKKVKKAAEYQASAEKVKLRVAKYRKENPEKVKACKHASYAKKPEEYKKKHHGYYHANKDIILLKSAEYRKANAATKKARDAAYREANKERLNARQSVYQRENWDRIREYRRAYCKERIKKDPIYALRSIVRRRLLFAFSSGGYSKDSRTQDMLGCGFAELKMRLEGQFKPGMTWDNRGDWHIDHITPLASANNKEETIKLCHYTNLQPLWAAENLSEGARMPHLTGAV